MKEHSLPGRAYTLNGAMALLREAESVSAEGHRFPVYNQSGKTRPSMSGGSNFMEANIRKNSP